jgi:hypothetical protein
MELRFLAAAFVMSTGVRKRRGASRSAESARTPDKDRWAGKDLVLDELSRGAQMYIGNVSEFGFAKKGDRPALIVDAGGRAGNGVLRNMAKGANLKGAPAPRWLTDGVPLLEMKEQLDKRAKAVTN